MSEIQKRISVMIDQGRLHHAFLMVGAGDQTHQEKINTSLFLASQVLAQSSQSTAQEIEKRIEKKYHPDFFQISSSDTEIKVDQILELISWIYKAPNEGAQKFALIEHAHRLNQNAANALLKTLEEPPAHATLILCAPSKDQLLQTLRSRMFVLQFAQSDEQEPDEDQMPAWYVNMKSMVEKEQFDEKVVFDLTQTMSKERPDLYYFFQFIQAHLKNKIQNSANLPVFHQYNQLFQKSLSMEHQIYRRYGNIALHLDTFFLDWKSRIHS